MGALFLLTGPTAAQTVTPAARPPFAEVAKTVAAYFATLEDYKPADMISQSHVVAALESVAAAGWEVPNKDAIVKRALADNSFLVKELSTPAGRSFMRRLGKHAGTYSRLDRLSTIAEGQNVVRTLIQAKDGDLMIQYMATTPGGHNLGKMMNGAQQGVDLNKPTGRIYTAADLMNVLKRAYGK